MKIFTILFSLPLKLDHIDAQTELNFKVLFSQPPSKGCIKYNKN